MHLESETKKEILYIAAYTLEPFNVRKKALKKPLIANKELLFLAPKMKAFFSDY